jgi:5-deoxy-glucuronate isomerase
MSTTPHTNSERQVFRATNAKQGRNISVSPDNSTNRHLAYGRIILDDSQRIEFSNGDRETGFIVLSGAATVLAGGQSFQLGKFDAAYIPRDSQICVTAEPTVDIAEFSAEVENQYPPQIVRFEQVSNDPALKFATGSPGAQRHLHMLLAKNIDAGRLVAGFTYSEPGNWTSWPPHEHAKMLEEMYVYFDMPEPAYAIQMVYNDTNQPELVTVVREGDAVLMPSGYHPNVSVPGHRICFLWAMAAHREVEDRQFGVVNVQPGFDQVASGLEKGRKN